MKKISVLILSFILFTSALFPAAVHANDVQGAFSRAEALLLDLGIAKENTVGTDGVPRGEFCNAVSAMLNIGYVGDGQALPFVDVTKDSIYYDGVYNCWTYGLISNADYFYPERIITYSEAVKIIVSALGYDFIAVQKGGYPAGYIYAASIQGLLDGVLADGFSYDDAVILMYNALLCPLPEIEVRGGEGYSKIDSGVCLLESMWGLFKYSGTFTGAQFFGGQNKSGVGNNRAEIDGKYIFQSGKYDTDAFYGYSADVFVDKEGVINSVYVFEANDNDVLLISSDKNPTLLNGTYYYDGADLETETVNISKNAIIVLNGSVCTYDEKLLSPEYGSVKIVKNRASEAVIVESYEEIIVGRIIKDENYIVDIRDSKRTYTYNENTTDLEVYDTENKLSSFQNIDQYSVLWICKNEVDRRDKIIICKDKINGAITEFDAECIYIDGQDYKVKKQNSTSLLDNSVHLGSVVTCYFNPNGEIVYLRNAEDSGTLDVGYLVYGTLTGEGLKKTISAKILTTSGVLEIYDFADNISVNGQFFKGDAQSVYNSFPKEEGYNSILVGLVSYKLSDDNKLTQLNYSDNISKEAFTSPLDTLFNNATVDGVGDEYTSYTSMQMAINNKSKDRIFVDYNTIRFFVPHIADYNIAEDSDYKVQTFNQILSGTKMVDCDNKGYSLDKDALLSTYVTSVYPLSSSSSLEQISVTSKLFMVESVKTAVTEDGAIVEKLYVCSSAGKNEFISEKERFFTNIGVKAGDLVKLEYNSKNVVSTALLVCHADSPEFVMTSNISSVPYDLTENNCVANAETGMQTLSKSILISGNIYNMVGKIVHLSPAKNDITKASDNLYKFYIPATQIYKYDIAKSEVTRLSDLSELKDYVHTGKCSRMVMEVYYGNVQSVYVYE